MKRYYYKVGKNYLNLKSPVNNPNYIEITEKEFYDATTPKEPTESMKKQKLIAEYKAKLKATDYKAIKFAEGELSISEYAETKEQRRKWRSEINSLELQLKNLK